jgi:hypothetical protein
MIVDQSFACITGATIQPLPEHGTLWLHMSAIWCCAVLTMQPENEPQLSEHYRGPKRPEQISGSATVSTTLVLVLTELQGCNSYTTRRYVWLRYAQKHNTPTPPFLGTQSCSAATQC